MNTFIKYTCSLFLCSSFLLPLPLRLAPLQSMAPRSECKPSQPNPSKPTVDEYISQNLPPGLKANGAIIREYLPVTIRFKRKRPLSAPLVPIQGLFKATGHPAQIQIGGRFNLAIIFVDIEFADDPIVWKHALHRLYLWNKFRRQKLPKEVANWQDLSAWVKKEHKWSKQLAEIFYAKASCKYDVEGVLAARLADVSI